MPQDEEHHKHISRVPKLFTHMLGIIHITCTELQKILLYLKTSPPSAWVAAMIAMKQQNYKTILKHSWNTVETSFKHSTNTQEASLNHHPNLYNTFLNIPKTSQKNLQTWLKQFWNFLFNSFVRSTLETSLKHTNTCEMFDSQYLAVVNKCKSKAPEGNCWVSVGSHFRAQPIYS